MTLVVGMNGGDFALVAADSRITTDWPDRLRTHVDCCQKVLRIGDGTIIGFCGDLVAIAEILTTFSMLYQANPAAVSIEQFESKLGVGLREGSSEFCSRMGRPFNVGVLVAGCGTDGRIRMLQCRPPDYNVEKVQTYGFAAMGSGEPVVERVARDFVRHMPGIISFHGDPLRAPAHLAWQLGSWVEGHLGESGVDSVGRILHTLCVDRKGVFPVPYGISRLTRLDDERFETEVILGTKKDPDGEWVQYSDQGREIVLKNPIDLIGDLAIFRRDQTIPLWLTRRPTSG